MTVFHNLQDNLELLICNDCLVVMYLGIAHLDFCICFQIKEEEAWRIEFYERVLRPRERCLGNVRFCGELFKLKVGYPVVL